MNLPSLPKHTHASHEYEPLHTSDAMQAYGQQCREAALLEAINATLPFDATGRVIAAVIRSFK